MPQPKLIEALETKVARLIADNTALREQAAKLRRTEERMRAERLQMQQQAADLERRVQVLELSGSMGGGRGEQKRARARVNRLLREVDKCIALVIKQNQA